MDSRSKLRSELDILRKQTSELEKAMVQEHPTKLKKAYLARQWEAFEMEVNRASAVASTSTLPGGGEDTQLNLAHSSLEGATMCMQLGRKHWCRFLNGKCLNCSRKEAAFRASYELPTWREQEEAVLQTEKTRYEEELQRAYHEKQARLLQEVKVSKASLAQQREEWESTQAQAVLQWTTERDSALSSLAAERAALQAGQAALAKARSELALSQAEARESLC